jgi:hypothetical protein
MEEFKRRIDREQIRELSENEIRRLRELWTPHSGNLIWMTTNVGNHEEGDVEVITYAGDYKYNGSFMVCDDDEDCAIHKDKCLPLLDITQMIELLIGKRVKVDFMNDKRDIAAELIFAPRPDFIISKRSNLCDALWEAVVEILKQEAEGKSYAEALDG